MEDDNVIINNYPKEKQNISDISQNYRAIHHLVGYEHRKCVSEIPELLNNCKLINIWKEKQEKTINDFSCILYFNLLLNR